MRKIIREPEEWVREQHAGHNGNEDPTQGQDVDVETVQSGDVKLTEHKNEFEGG